MTQKEYKAGQDWVGKIIYWELCKRLKFDHTNKWFMYKPESLLKNETHVIQIQTITESRLED